MKVLILTDSDLDGSGCALLLKWMYIERGATVNVKEIVGQEYDGILQSISKSFGEYDIVYITDLYVSDVSVQYVDKSNVVIIDHHEDHIVERDKYKNSKVIMKNYPSCSKLIYDLFKSKMLPNTLTDDRVRLIELINDYDSFALKFKDTLKIYAIFSSINRPKVDKFIDMFYDGMRPYTIEEINMISLHFKKIKYEMDIAEVYGGKIKNYNVISFCVSYGINEVSHYLLKKYNADIAIAIILPGYVSFRRAGGCNAKLNILAQSLCDGGGHEYAAGGKITPKFLELTKQLKLL